MKISLPSPPDSPLRELDSRDKVHLNWMFENQPTLVRRLFQTGKLYEHLDRKMQRALERVDNLKQKLGLSEDEAFEIATSEILAPPDGPAVSDNPPEPVPWPEQRAIWHNL